MDSAKKRNQIVIILAVLSIVSILSYLFLFIRAGGFQYAMYIRVPKVLAITLSAFCIGSASLVFQSLINNNVVSPSLLGMNSLYILIHTLVVFALGTTNAMSTNKLLSFIIDLVVMGVVAVVLYGYLFKKTKGNLLYILLAGTVMATLFSSITSSMQRMMDPNEFNTLQNSLIASFNKVNSEILLIAFIAAVLIIVWCYKELKLLNVITLGRDQAINLGVNYDRVNRKLLVGVAIYIAIATALVGPISFLGLIVANISRQLFKTYKHTYLIYGSVFIGIIMLLVGQLLIEQVFHFSVNISVFINIGGGLYFLYLLTKARR